MRDYFEHIKPVCPHSLESFDQGRLLVFEYHPSLLGIYYETLENYDAVLFKCHPSTIRDDLISMVEDLSNNKPDAMWFWSHPEDEHYSTSVPSIIMQNKETLQTARKEYKMKLKDMEQGINGK